MGPNYISKHNNSKLLEKANNFNEFKDYPLAISYEHQKPQCSNRIIVRIWETEGKNSVGHVSFQVDDTQAGIIYYFSVWPEQEITSTSIEGLKVVPAKCMPDLIGDEKGEDNRKYTEIDLSGLSYLNKEAMKIHLINMKEEINSGKLSYCLSGKPYIKMIKGVDKCVNCVTSVKEILETGGIKMPPNTLDTPIRPSDFSKFLSNLESAKTIIVDPKDKEANESEKLKLKI